MSRPHRVSVLQWNMKGDDESEEIVASRRSVLAALLKSKEPSLVAIQEAVPGTMDLLLRANYEPLERGSGLVSAFRRDRWLGIDVEGTEFKMRAFGIRLRDVVDHAILAFWNVHLWSRRNTQDETLRDKDEEFSRFLQVRRLEKEWATAPEIIAGDYNLPPYDPFFYKQRGMNAHRSLAWARTLEPDAYGSRPLYNPTWSIFGRRKPPFGTYYMDKEFDKPWYVLDHILLSPDVVGPSGANVELLHTVDRIPLHTMDGIRQPDATVGSDHFPIYTYFTKRTIRPALRLLASRSD